MSGPLIRRARPGDVEVLLGLVAEYCAVDSRTFDAERIRAALVPLLIDDTHGQVWVHLTDASADAGVATEAATGAATGASVLDGYVVVTWSWSLESGGAECLIDELSVRHRRRGHGRALVEQALTAARERGCRVAFLETEAHNEDARTFYAALGFDREASVWLSQPLG
ncbi:MAG: GNAT family N-acetyltransferase [Actinomycetota bacterium]|nr:GNAT family N-acetyltransferase [Actinomycetota bacterium]